MQGKEGERSKSYSGGGIDCLGEFMWEEKRYSKALGPVPGGRWSSHHKDKECIKRVRVANDKLKSQIPQGEAG